MKIENVDINLFEIITTTDKTSIVAGQELQYYLEKYCNYYLDSRKFVGKIYVGFSMVEDFVLPMEKLENDDSFVIKTAPNRLYICGKTSEGTLYGVYHFLNMIGVDWLTATQEMVKMNDEQNIQGELVYNFCAQLRHAFGYGTNYADNKFFIRQRLKRTVGETNNQPFFADIHGVEYAFGWGMFGHTFEWFIPYDEYFSNHPEYFSFAKGFYGDKGKYQICLTNPEVFEIVKTKTLDYLSKHPTCKIVSISQNDSWGDFTENFCKCDNCRKIYEREGNTDAGVLLTFVNQIADAVAEQYPDVLVHTFAYKSTVKPPLHIKPRSNVIVQLCLSHKPHWTMLSNEESCICCKESFDAWKKISHKLHIWTYLVNHGFYFSPVANLESIYVDTTYMLQAGVYGIFQQENDDDFPFEFNDLRLYLVAKLFQNPYMSHEEYLNYVKKFLCGFYGKASANYIYDYLLELEKVSSLDATKLSNNTFAMLDNSEKLFNNKAFIEQGRGLWQRALDNAENDLYKKRIEDSKKSFDFAELVYLYENVQNEQDLQAYARKKETLYTYAYLHRNVLIYGEGWGRRVQDISKIDWKTPPRVLRNLDKEIKLVGKNKSSRQYSEANTDESIKDFSFNFDVQNVGDKLIFHIEVMDNDSNHIKEITDWEQDSVELFFSESFHKNKTRKEGDFSLRINANGDWLANGKEDRMTVASHKTENGYLIEVEVLFDKNLLAVGKKIGFEMIAHNIGDKGYLNTVYWNSPKCAIMNEYPALCGKIEFL